MSKGDQVSPSSTLPAYSVDFDHALSLAAIVHRVADRKGTRVPYIIHPFHVALILLRHGYPEPVQLAGLLHDVLEDGDPSDREMRDRLGEAFPELDPAIEGPAFKTALAALMERRFGPRVLSLVEAMTQKKHDDGGKAIPVQVRRREVVQWVSRCTDSELVGLKAADALHNTRSIVNDLRAVGLPMMARFKGTPVETLQYYRALGDAVADRLGASHALARELRDAVEELMATFERALDEGMRSGHPEGGV